MAHRRASRAPTRSVLLVHPSDEGYGADRVLLQLALGLRSRGWRVRCLIADDQPGGWLSGRFSVAGVEFRKGPLAPARRRYLTIFGLPRYAVALARARRWVRDEAQAFGADVIHVNTSALLVASILGRPGGARLVWHIHEIVVRPRLSSWIFRIAPVLAADRVIAISRAVRDHLIPRSLARTKSDVVWNGIDQTSGQRENGEPGLVAFIGRLNRWKGYEVFLDAAARAIRASPSARFLVVGDPPQGEEWRTRDVVTRIAKLGLADRVTATGYTDDVSSVLDRVAIVVVPSVWPEPFGLVTLEAMLAGRAVIASAHGGALDLIEDGKSGILVRPGDCDALASAILALVNDPAMTSRIGKEARVRAMRHFSSARFLDGIERAYRP